MIRIFVHPTQRWLAAALLAAAPARAAQLDLSDWHWPPDAAVEVRIRGALERHPEGKQIAAWLESASAAERLSAEFLLAWMPASDLGALGAARLSADVREALDAWDAAPWSAAAPPALFFHYVLPYRISQEPPQDWRPRLRAELAERVAGLDLEQATIEVNRWCNERVDFVSTSARDQPPLATLERGYGRCEERMILAIAAMRSVAIPARTCSTPWWTTTDNNHAWLEAWSGAASGWAYLEACDGSLCLNHAWFSRPAQRAGIVISTAWGELDAAALGGDHLLHSKEGATTINSTATYTEPGVLRIPARDDSLEVAVYAFNYGGLFPLVTIGGGESVELGPGDYVVSAARGESIDVEVATIRSGRESLVSLDRGTALFDAPVWLRYPRRDTEVPPCPRPGDDNPRWLRHQLARERNLRARDIEETPGRDWIAALGSHSDAGELEDALRRAGNARGAWESLLLSLEGEEAACAHALIQEMDDKDFRELDPSALPELARRMNELRSSHCPDLPDSTWRQWIISPRLYLQAGTQRWWTALPVLEPEASLEQILARFRGRVREAERSRFGHVATPEETWRSGWASMPSAKACLTALMRINGVPARALRGREEIDVLRDGQWRALPCFASPGAAGEPGAPDAPDQARLRVRYTAKGEAYAAVSTWRHTLLSRFRDGAFRPVFEGQLWERDAEVAWELAPGTYWLSGGMRNSLGEPRFSMRRLQLAAGDTLQLEMEIGIPLDELDEGSLVRRQLDPDQSCALVDAGGRATDLANLLPEGPALLLLSREDHEPSARHRTALQAAAKLPTLVEIVLAEDTAAPPARACALIEAAECERVFGISDPATELPLTILLDEQRRTRIWISGMQLGMADLVRGRIPENQD